MRSELTAVYDGAVLRLSTEGRVLQLSDPQRPYGDEIIDVLVDLAAPGVRAHAPVTTFAGDSLPDFLSELARDYRGWRGQRVWSSLESQLEVTATWHNGGHVGLRVVLQPVLFDPEWEVAGVLYVEAGAQMEGLASDARDLFRLR